MKLSSGDISLVKRDLIVLRASLGHLGMLGQAARVMSMRPVEPPKRPLISCLTKETDKDSPIRDA